MKPTTLQERVDLTIEEFSKDPIFYGKVMNGMSEKTAAAETPAEVLRITAEVEKATGMAKEAAQGIAWDTYLRYVNPDFMKHGGKVPPQFMKKKEEAKKEPPKGAHKSAAAELAEKLGVAVKAPEKAEKSEPKKAEPAKTAAAVVRDLAKTLGV